MGAPVEKNKLAMFMLLSWEEMESSSGIINTNPVLTSNLTKIYFTLHLNYLNYCTLCGRQSHIKIGDFYETWICRYLDYDFFQLFRMGRSTFNKLLSVVCHIKMKHEYTQGTHFGGLPEVPLEKSLLIFLWYVGKGEVLVSIADRFNVAVSTCYNIVTKCLEYFIELIEIYIKWPSIRETILVETEFRKLAGFPGVIGAIDGCHIPIKCAMNQQDSYTNRKLFKSIILQGICTASKLFSNIYVGFPGSAHDSRVFRNSGLYLEILEKGEIAYFGDTGQYHLVGDSAYPLKTWLITPYDGVTVTRRQKTFNYKHSVTRVVIENVFGLLKCRWRILKYIDVNCIKRAVLIISACCVLHNFCLINKDIYDNLEDNQLTDSDDESTNNELQHGDTSIIIAKRKRDDLCNILVSAD